jgi:peptide chain release factor 2
MWDDPESAQKAMQELSALKEQVDPWNRLQRQVADLREYAEMIGTEEDPELLEAMEQELHAARKDLESLELATLLGGEHDRSNAILELNAGAGGTEACDWVDMLFRMYVRWAEHHHLAYEVADQVPGEVAGSKSITLFLRGGMSYGYLKGESGVHRLVRISPFDANKRRHTSFASVSVLPEIEEAQVNLDMEDVRVDTFRSGGAGGQHMQKNETAVRLTHIPTGIVVACQNERSQGQNRMVAMRVLMARLYDLQQAQARAKVTELRGEQRAIEWGSQIRSYVFQPYTLVKDHRTGVETGNVIAVMDGEIDAFLQGYLRKFGASSDGHSGV